MDDKIMGATVGGLAALATGNPAAFLKPLYDAYTFAVGDGVEERLRAEMDGLVTAVAQLECCDREEAAHRLVDLMARCRPEVKDLVYDTHRTIFFAKSRAAWPYVLKLTADRVVNNEGVPDTFSRRAAWLLERCEEEDIEVLNGALARTVLIREAAPPDKRNVLWAAHRLEGISIHAGAGMRAKQWSSRHIDEAGLRYRGMIDLLVNSRLGTGQVPGVVYFAAEEGHLNRLVALFQMPTPDKSPPEPPAVGMG